MMMLFSAQFAQARQLGQGSDSKSSLAGREIQPQNVEVHKTAVNLARSEPGISAELKGVERQALLLVRAGLEWYRQTPPSDRVCWGGLLACAGLGAGVFIERMVLLKRRRVIPADFTARFLDRLHEGKLDGGKALDYCEMNPSPAARVALAAIRRWGRPAIDLERAVAMAHRVEADRLRRNVGTLRRIAALTPLLGLLATLLGTARVLAMTVPAVTEATTVLAPVVGTTVGWGPALAAALNPLIAGVAIATLALVAYDALSTRIERLAGALDRLGAETIDAIAMMAPTRPPTLLAAPSHFGTVKQSSGSSLEPRELARTPHQQATSRRREEATEKRNRPSHNETGF
jgi:biopolymer transport protein ExbB